MFRAGFVTIVGRPNVGKSTLLNALVGQKVAIATNRVQTTRYRIRGVLTLPGKGQIVFIDTPGLSKPLDDLGEFLTQEAKNAWEDGDCFLLVVDGSQPCGKGDTWLISQLQESGKYILLLLNKMDQVKVAEQREALKQSYLAPMAHYEHWDYLTVSAKTGKRLGEITKTLLKHLPPGEAAYDEDSVTDQSLREIAQEMIREKAMVLTEDELPHSIAVQIQKFDESDPACTRISATLFVDQTSQKGMVIGKGGQKIKQIGQAARQDIEALVEGPVFLDLTVKVKVNWRKDPQFLKSLGLS